MLSNIFRPKTLIRRADLHSVFNVIGSAAPAIASQATQKVADQKVEEPVTEVKEPELSVSEVERQNILKQKRVLRRYLRLRRNNYSQMHEADLTEEWFAKSYTPKLQSILDDNDEFLHDIKGTAPDSIVQISSYMPIKYEMNIVPVMRGLLGGDQHHYAHSLPVVVKRGEPLVFREYNYGDHLESSKLFNVLEPTEEKAQVYPQVLIIPLMGFMEDCHRIGYGGGFYDRTIEQIRNIYDGKMLMIGVAFEAQKFDKFTGHLAGLDPFQEDQCTKISKMRAKFANNSAISWVQLDTDEPLDYIVTETNIYKKEI